MIDTLFNILSEALYKNLWISLLGSFGWGILSILLSPCHLSSIPLIIGFISSQRTLSTKRGFLISLVFTSGIFITITLIGIITASLGRLMGDVGTTVNYFMAALFIFIGLYLLDIIKLNWTGIRLSSPKYKGLPAAFILGLIFGIGVGPCTFAYMAPVLGVVFQTAQTNLANASVILIAFGIGHCLIIVVAGTFTSKVQRYLNWSENSNYIIWIKKVCGVLVILAGVYQIYNLLYA
jgi:cytochrome c-type biogenesis protein